MLCCGGCFCYLSLKFVDFFFFPFYAGILTVVPVVMVVVAQTSFQAVFGLSCAFVVQGAARDLCSS